MSRARRLAKASLTTGRRAITGTAIAQLSVLAKLRGLKLNLDIAPGARIDAGTRWVVTGVGTASLEVCDGAIIEPGVEIHLTPGASLHLGPQVQIRSGCVLGVYGDVRFEGRNLFSWGSILQCRRQIIFEEMAGTGEHVSVVDGNHYRIDADDHWFGRSTYGPVRIGRNAWLAAKSVITAGVTIGPAATIAAGAVVVSDVPAEALAGGIPAKVLKRDINGAPPAGSDTEATDLC